jgi:hypothetical protein
MDVRKVLDLEDDASTESEGFYQRKNSFWSSTSLKKDLDNIEASSSDGSEDENEDSQRINLLAETQK